MTEADVLTLIRRVVECCEKEKRKKAKFEREIRSSNDDAAFCPKPYVFLARQKELRDIRDHVRDLGLDWARTRSVFMERRVDATAAHFPPDSTLIRFRRERDELLAKDDRTRLEEALLLTYELLICLLELCNLNRILEIQVRYLKQPLWVWRTAYVPALRVRCPVAFVLPVSGVDFGVPRWWFGFEARVGWGWVWGW